MDRISLHEVSTFRWSFEEDVRRYRAAGYSSIGVWRQKISDYGEEKGAELLADVGLHVSSLSWAGGFTGSDGRSFKDSLEDARDALRVARLINTDCLVLYSGARAGHTLNHARRLLKSALQELAPEAAELGIRLAVEPMHAGCAAEWTFLTTLEDTLALLDSVGEAGTALVLDSYHCGHDADILQRLAALVPRIALVHLGDARQPPCGEQNRCQLGQGSLPIEAMLEILQRSGYRGFYEIELLGEEFEAVCYDALIAASLSTARQLLSNTLLN
jgi:sugar phosphate isomerase/epimerase